MTITRCPDCQTAFRLSEEQRTAAEGLVRCGVCTRVFRADRHLVADEPLPDWQSDASPTTDGAIEESYIRELLGGPTPEDWPEGIFALIEQDSANGEATPDTTSTDGAHTEIMPEPVGPVTANEAAALDVAGPIPAFTPPPIEIEATVPPRRARSIVWALGCTLTAFALLAQYGWHERAHLLEDPKVRPWLEHACTVLDCALPRPAAPGAIRSEALLIRPAPERNDVLLVDALLSNRAAYSQPWPGLAISFQDLRGRTLAGRVFGASEYLPEPPRADMPTGPAIAVHLELHDPGEQATGYRMDILPQEAVHCPDGRAGCAGHPGD